MKVIWDGLFKKNPVFILLLGLVPAIAVTSTAMHGWYLALITGLVFVMGTVINKLVIEFFPENARAILRFAILTLLTVLCYSILLQVNPQLIAELGIFLPLIVFNSMLLQPLAIDESFGTTILKAVGQSLGFILALILIGMVREFLGFGAIFGKQILDTALPPLALATSVPGGMIIVGLLLALANKLTGQGGELHD